MKLIRAYKNKLSFYLGPREKKLFAQVLELYPRIPPSHPRVSRTSSPPEAEESQRLLDEALAEQRADHKLQIQSLLTDPKRLIATENGWRLSVSRIECEWLLQILNDIRVGSWLSLGSPEDIHAALTKETAPDFWAMEMAGLFQSQFLEAINPRPDVG